MPDSNWWQALWPNPDEVLSQLGFQATMSALDICCGDGLFLVPMAKRLAGKVYALDIDREMLTQAQKAIAQAKTNDCIWLEADAMNLADLIPEKLDVAFIANTFHGVPQQTAMAQSVFEILKPGGKFIIINWHKKPREQTTVLDQPRGPRTELRMSPEDVQKVVELAGFVIEQCVELPPFHYGAIFKKP